MSLDPGEAVPQTAPPRTHWSPEPDLAPEPVARPWHRLAVLGGMRPNLVERFPGDRHLFVAIAFILFATTAEAMAAGGFAISRAFSDAAGRSTVPVVGIIAFALVWGLIIFSIDRFMVLGLDGVHGFRALILMLFRGVLAAVLGFVMATPLVIAVFDSDIQAQVRLIQGEQIQALEGQRDAAKAKYDSLHAQQLEATKAVQDAEARRTPDPSNDPAFVAASQKAAASAAACADAQNKAGREFNGNLPVAEGGSATSGDGPQYRALKAAADKLCAVADDDLAAKNAAHQQASQVPDDVDTVVAQKKDELAKATEAAGDAYQSYQASAAAITSARAGQSPGLLTSMAALDRLTAQDRNAWWGHFGLVFLLICLELMPVLFKGVKQALHGWRDPDWLTPYEQACKDQDDSVRQRLLGDLRQTTVGATEAADLRRAAMLDMRAKQEALQADLNDEIVASQRALVGRALADWRREEALRLGHDPDDVEAEVRGARR